MRSIAKYCETPSNHNALCHRDYSNRSGSISLAIFDTHIEIWNNGTLPREIKLKDLKHHHESMPRNERIAKVFHARGLIETWGTGTNKMIDDCRAEGIPDPEFKERTGAEVSTHNFLFSPVWERGRLKR